MAKTFAEFMQATNFLENLRSAIEQAGMEYQRRKMVQESLNQLARIYAKALREQDVFTPQVQQLGAVAPVLLQSATTPQEVAQMYFMLGQSFANIMQQRERVGEALKTIDEIQKSLTEKVGNLQEAVKTLPQEYRDIISDTYRMYQNVVGTVTGLARALVQTGNVEAGIQLVQGLSTMPLQVAEKVGEVAIRGREFERSIGLEERKLAETTTLERERLRLIEQAQKMERELAYRRLALEEDLQKLRWAQFASEEEQRKFMQEVKRAELDLIRDELEFKKRQFKETLAFHRRSLEEELKLKYKQLGIQEKMLSMKEQEAINKEIEKMNKEVNEYLATLNALISGSLFEEGLEPGDRINLYRALEEGRVVVFDNGSVQGYVGGKLVFSGRARNTDEFKSILNTYITKKRNLLISMNKGGIMPLGSTNLIGTGGLIIDFENAPGFINPPMYTVPSDKTKR